MGIVMVWCLLNHHNTNHYNDICPFSFYVLEFQPTIAPQLLDNDIWLFFSLDLFAHEFPRCLRPCHGIINVVTFSVTPHIQSSRVQCLALHIHYTVISIEYMLYMYVCVGEIYSHDKNT